MQAKFIISCFGEGHFTPNIIRRLHQLRAGRFPLPEKLEHYLRYLRVKLGTRAFLRLTDY